MVPKFSSNPRQAKLAAVRQEISTISGAMDAFEEDNGRYPTAAEGLAALLVRPPNAPSWRGPYVTRDMQKDPWGNPYVYRNPGKHNSNGFDVFSTGPDGREGGGDDISNWP